MLRLEKLICKDKEFHKDCEWQPYGRLHQDGQYLLVKNKATKEVRVNGEALRIRHDRLGILITIKRGHDGQLFVCQNEDAFRKFLFRKFLKGR